MTELRLPRHARNHLPGGSDPIPGLITHAPISTFFDAVMALAVTSDLRGYWRLGDGGLGPYADSKPAGTWVNTPMARVNNTVDMTDIDPGALPASQDDGAVQFNLSTGATTSDFLRAPNVWSTSAANPFEGDIGTVAAWIKPAASATTFDGGAFSMLAFTAAVHGYALGVAWPSRSVFHQRGATRLTGPVLAADTWVFATAVKDSTSTRIYLNGALVATGAAVDGTPGTNISPLIGLWNESAGTSGLGPGVFYGAVDEVTVWATALADASIATLWAAGAPSMGGGATGGVVVDSFSKQGATRLTGDVTVSAGTNITLTQTGQNVQIAAPRQLLAQQFGPMPGAVGSAGMYRVPFFAGASVTFTLARASLHLEKPGSTSSVLVIEKSSTVDVFTPVAVATLTVTASSYSATDVTAGLGTVQSGDLIRFRWTSLGTGADSFHAQLEGTGP